MSAPPLNSSRGLLYFASFLALVYYLPVALILVGVIPFGWKYYVLAAMTGMMALYMAARKRSFASLGFRRDTLVASFTMNGALSIAFIGMMVALFALGVVRPAHPRWDLFLVFYLFISSPCQEFMFRSALFSEMAASGINSPRVQVAISAVTFCFLHVIYRDAITLAVTLFMGVVWGTVYVKAPNYWGLTLSHAVLGIVAILVGLIR